MHNVAQSLHIVKAKVGRVNVQWSPYVVLEAVRGTREYGFHFWDAQIWAAARLNGIATILSEDFGAGAEIEGVRFANPFAREFSPEDWGL